MFLWGDARGWVVWVANVNQSLLGGREHLRQIVCERLVERNLNYFRAADSRMVEDRFERWIGYDQFAAARDELQSWSPRWACQLNRAIIIRHWTGERRRADFQNLARPIA